jgi:CobQ-like glutamine amidotransferase family enzyme
MNLTIGYLYYDLLNLYGENGNVKILKKQLENQGIEVEIKLVTIDDDLDFDQYDLVYIGAGTENNQKIALNHLLKYKKKIKEAIKRDKHFLITGNSIELFGKYICDKNQIKYEALNIFDFSVNEEPLRMMTESLFKTRFLNQPILGFQNQNSVIKDLKETFFDVIEGIGSFPGSNEEGIKHHNFYGTYLVGPILVRNPHFLEFFIRDLVKTKIPNFKFKNFDLKLEKEAYKVYISNFHNNKVN